MSQNQVLRTNARVFDFLEPAMNPEYARTDHGVLKPAGAGTVVSYRKGQIVMQKDDGTNEWAKIGEAGYTGPPRIVKYSVLVNEDGAYQFSEKDAWNDLDNINEGSVDLYYQGYFKTQDLVGSGGTNEVQTETIDAAVDGGTRTLKFGPYTTEPIAFDAVAADIQAALLLLPNLASGDVVVSGLGPFVYTFGGAYAGSNVPLLEVDGSELTDGGVAVEDGSTIVETTPGAALLTGVGRLVRGTSSSGIMQLGVGTPS